MAKVNIWGTAISYTARHAEALANANGINIGKARNAIAHAHVSASLAVSLGSADAARLLGDFKEFITSSETSSEDTFKDQHNNEVGRRIGLFVNSLGLTGAAKEEAIDDLVIYALNQGALIVDEATDVRVAQKSAPIWAPPVDSVWQSASAGRNYNGVVTDSIVLQRLGSLLTDWVQDAAEIFKKVPEVISFSVSQADGADFSVSIRENANAAMAVVVPPSGTQFAFDAVSGIGLTIAGTTLVGHESTLVYNSFGQIEFRPRVLAGNGILEMPDGTKITSGLPSSTNMSVASLSGAAPIEALVSYLGSIGHPINTVAELDQLKFAQLHPAGATPYNPTFTTAAVPFGYHYFTNTGLRQDGRKEVVYKLSNAGPAGAQINAAASVTYVDTTPGPTFGMTVTSPTYNKLVLTNPNGSGANAFDLSRHNVSNIQLLDVSQLNFGFGYALDISITAAQWASIGSIYGFGKLRAASAGVYDLSKVQLYGGTWNSGSIDDQFRASIAAESFSGTTLVGIANVDLEASLFGNDTLQAGSGGARLSAGYGVNQIVGGSGADTIRLRAGQLAAGSTITGGGGVDLLTSTATENDVIDIGSGSVSGVENVSLNARSFTLNAASLTGFSSIQTGNSGGLMLIGSNAGTYSLAGKSLTGTINLTGSNGNDTLVGGSTTQKLYGGAGDDRLTYTASITNIDGGSGNDTLVFSGSAPSTINLTATNIGATTLSGIESIDTSGISTAVTITGDSDANTLKGGTAADTLLGGDGDDTIVYDAVDVLADGGNGFDTLVLNQTVATTVNLSQFADQVTGGGTTVNFEAVDGTGSTAALNITGDGNANTLKGGTGGDTISGGSGSDTIAGGGGADSLYGNAGDDTITYHAGATRIEGGDGNDTLILPYGVTYDLTNATSQVSSSVIVTGFEQVVVLPPPDLVLTGDAGNNTLTGGVGNDTLDGLGGDDVLDGGAGADRIFGGAGSDTIFYDASDVVADGGAGVDILFLRGSQPSTINLATANQVVGSSNVVTGFEYVHGVEMTNAITVTGDANNNVLNMGSGNDIIDGGAGFDTLYGNGGDDRIIYDAADALADGGAGSDTLVVNRTTALTIDLRNADQVAGDTGGTSGFEHVDGAGSTGSLTIVGAVGNSTLRGGSARDIISDAGGDDIIDGGGGNDSLFGNGGNDSIVYGTAASVIDGGAGNDTLVMREAAATTINLAATSDQVVGGGTTAGFEYIDGTESSGALTMFGDAGTNILRGGSGADWFYASTGADERYGGAGDDIFIYAPSAAMSDGEQGNNWLAIQQGTLTVDLKLTSDQTIGDAGVVKGIVNLDGLGNTSALALTGDTNANFIRGGSGSDTLSGWAGNDVIYYDPTDIFTEGGTGIDTLVVNDQDSRAFRPDIALTIDLSNVTDQVVGGGLTATFESINGSQSTAALTVTGSLDANNIWGGSANDVLDGGAGSDRLYGGAGSDTIFYDTADILADGGAGVDILFLRGSQPSTINLAAANQVVGSTNVVTGFEYVHGVEMTNAITVTGDANNNILNMGSGNDIIDGGAGIDSLYGNGGDDRIVYEGTDALADGGTGSDTLVVNRTTALTIDLRNADQVAGDAGGTTSFENVDGSGSTASLTIVGAVGNSTLRGGSAQDIISDAGGNDTIDGGAGADYIYGNGGDDTIFYDMADLVTDGGAGTDILFLRGSQPSTINLSLSDQVVGGGTTSGFEYVHGVEMTNNITVSGNSLNNVLNMGSGNDIIDGGAGIDSLYGNGGDDRIVYDGADSVINGGSGSDWLVVSQAAPIAINLSNMDHIAGDSGVASGFENVDGAYSTGALTITGDSGANFLHGGSGNDTLSGGLGNDTLAGVTGSDTYLFARGDGNDFVMEASQSGADGDRLNFLPGINHDQLWFRQLGTNLDISVIGSTDKVTVSGWFGGASQQIETITAGGRELFNTNVIHLVNAMASMTPPPAGQTDLTTAERAVLDPVLAANWQVAA